MNRVGWCAFAVSVCSLGWVDQAISSKEFKGQGKGQGIVQFCGQMLDKGSSGTSPSTRPELTAEQERIAAKLARKYKIPKERVRFAASGLPVIVDGKSEAELFPVPSGPAVMNPKVYKVLILGGGPSGTTAAHYLTKAGLDTMLVERDATLGGLANGVTINGVEHAIGGAYSSGPYGPTEHAIYREFGLKNYTKKFYIDDPIDSLVWNGKIYNNFWEDPKVLAELPASFAVVKKAVEWADDNYINDVDLPLGQIPDQISAEKWITAMPAVLAKAAKTDPEAAEIFENFLKDPRIDHQDRNGMGIVLDALLDNYSRSALGEVTREISSVPWGDFYISEIGRRYTGPYGAGSIIQAVLKKITRPEIPLDIQTGATVLNMKNFEDFVEVTYVQDGILHKVRSERVLFAGNIKLAPRLIEGFKEQAPDRFQRIEALQTSNYNVHVVWTKGRVFTACYDLWLGFNDPQHTHTGAKPDPTDMIDFLYQSDEARAYRKKFGHEPDLSEKFGVYGIYQPLGSGSVGKGMTAEDSVAQAEHSVARVKSLLDPILQKKYGRGFEVEYVHTIRWPASIDVAKPGFQFDVEFLKRPFGRIHFALKAVPELEEAMRRGKEGADEIIRELKRDRQRREGQ